MKSAEKSIDPNLIVGLGTSDDAGVYRISADIALIQTVDFFTPVVDDPYYFGLIAAANALSDIYAMGGKPLTALNICCFSTGLAPEVLADILRGGADKIAEAGAVLVGGHTVTDNEIKYGLSVTGTVHPDKVIANAGARPGDVLVLTKPLGTGVFSTAFKNDAIGEFEFSRAVSSMAALNRGASEAMQEAGVNGCTDITGFGLAGHLYEMAAASGVRCKVDYRKLPFLEGLHELIEKEFVPGGAYNNSRHFGRFIKFSAGIPDTGKLAVFDPQTSGGLLISVPAEKADMLVKKLKEKRTLCAAIIGEVVEKLSGDEDIEIR